MGKLFFRNMEATSDNITWVLEGSLCHSNLCINNLYFLVLKTRPSWLFISGSYFAVNSFIISLRVWLASQPPRSSNLSKNKWKNWHHVGTQQFKIIFICFFLYVTSQPTNKLSLPLSFVMYLYIFISLFFKNNTRLSSFRECTVMKNPDVYSIRKQYHSLPADATTWSMMYTRKKKIFKDEVAGLVIKPEIPLACEWHTPDFTENYTE